MDFLQFLQNRYSQKKLVAPAPNREQLQEIFKAALRVPDHATLKPYHFHVLEGEKALLELRDLMLAACDELQLPEKSYEKAKKFHTRAPQIIVVTSRIIPEHKKVPEWEQLVTAGCATYAIQLAANALGFDNVWITGKWIDGTAIRQHFGCQEQDKIVALILSGTCSESKEKEDKRLKAWKEYVTFSEQSVL